MNRKIVVLDDDPTGTQTVHGVSVVTSWSTERLTRELEDPAAVVYVLTNSRSFTADVADRINGEIGANLREASRTIGRELTVVSRSDSTLRGHFPNEVDALVSALAIPFRAWILVPFFEAGGRLTVGDVHWVREGDRLVPAGLTPFARDRAFGFRSSNLREWVEEKTRGRVSADQVRSIGIDDIRSGGVARVREILGSLQPGDVCLVNAAEQRDVSTAVVGLLEEEAIGAHFLYRTAASFVAARAGIAPRPLLNAEDLGTKKGQGGLVVVGSHVPKSTEQLRSYLDARDPISVELRVDRVLVDSTREAEIDRVVEVLERGLRESRVTVLYTSRLVAGRDPDSSIDAARRVSAALVDVVRRVRSRPRYLLAKGGITSSDIATEACGIERTLVLGQIHPGVPVWRCGPESRFVGMPLVVFPGNVGDSSALTDVIDRLEGA